MKLGFEIRRSFNQDVVLDQVSGSFSFSTQPTSFPGNAATGNGLAPLLTGFATGFSENQTDQLLRHSYNLESFARDNWTLIRDPTLILGLRWEIDTPMIDENNRMNSFDLDQINPFSGYWCWPACRPPAPTSPCALPQRWLCSSAFITDIGTDERGS